MHDEHLQALKDQKAVAANVYEENGAEYDRGLHNGLETAIAIFESRHPNIKEAPENDTDEAV